MTETRELKDYSIGSPRSVVISKTTQSETAEKIYGMPARLIDIKVLTPRYKKKLVNSVFNMF